jgi:hypothetical protein
MLFGLLKATEPKQQAEVVPQKSINELIEEIHESFYTEVDKLLAEAKVMRPTESSQEDLIRKAERLRKLGFTATKETSAVIPEEKRIELAKQENNRKAELIEAIKYFSQKYPQYKFITEESVSKICEKYGLVYGLVSNYIGTVPDKNLEQMEQFKIHDEDKCYIKKSSSAYSDNIEICKMPDEFERKMRISSYFSVSYSQCPLEIAAPIKDFNTQGKELKGNKLVAKKIEIPDPVVLQPVYYKGTKHYLIVTAWGLEASDELVINERNN